MASDIVFTRKARCRDCHRCLRACPVKAIRVHDGQAQVVPERCIACGTCIRECPQKAKAYRNDVAEAIRCVSRKGRTVASVAPAYAGVFEPWEQRRLASALRRLGFGLVAETAVAAKEVARAGATYIQDHPSDPHVWASCPAIIEYVRRYRPDQASLLVPVASPMLAHARWLKQRFGTDTRVVFIGPCVAKKAEAERADVAGTVDAVLTFEELGEWLAQESIALSACEESEFDEVAGEARLYPLPEGALRTAHLVKRELGREAFSVSGFSDVEHALELLSSEPSSRVVEPLFCPGGCANGPATASKRNLHARRFAVEQHASATGKCVTATVDNGLLIDRGPAAQIPDVIPVSESSIEEMLARTGKTAPEDRLDCGACGYASCRDNAIAAVRGMAEPDMCIPHMRRLAEMRTDRILEASPNGIVVLDAHFQILSMNPAFRRLFRSGETMLGKHISELMDPEPFMRIAAGPAHHLELTVSHTRFGVLCHEILYELKAAQQYVGFFVDISENQSDQHKLEQLRLQTIAQAQELLDHQVAIAQQLAQFLGESTAKGEVLVENLIKLAGKNEGGNDPISRWRWNTNTSR
jgi:iron only hydrogenase large subunit-like protein/uncharacterized Fe-S cluster-containing protein